MRSALERHVGSPAAEALLLRMREMSPRDPDPRRAAARYGRLLEGADRLSADTRELLTDRIARNYRAAGDFGRADAAERETGYLRRWAVIGPFGYTRWSVHDREFPPEREIDFDRPVRSGHRELRWTIYEVRGSGRSVDLYTPVWPEEGAAYAVAQVRSEEERDAFLLLRCGGSFKAWLNGRAIADVDKGRKHSPDRWALAVRLGKGWNRLMLKVSAWAPVVSCRFTDGEGRPLGGLESEGRLLLREHARFASPRLESPLPGLQSGTGGAGRKLPGFQSGTGGAGRKLPGGGDLVAAGPARGGAASREPEPGLLALLHAADGLVDRHLGAAEGELEHLKKAVELAPRRAHLWYQLARTLEETRLLPKSLRRTRSQEAYERASACEGGFVPAELQLAERLRRDKKAELAIERLRKAAESNPDSPDIALLMARVALDEGWKHEARTWARDVEKIDPSSREVQLFWAALHSRQRNIPRAIVAYREALSLDERDHASHERLARLLAARGETSAGLRQLKKALEADPARLEGYRSLARAETEAGRHENAASTLRSALRLSPSYPWLLRQLGEVYLRQDREDRALEEWRRALEIYPGWHELRRQVEAAEGTKGDFSIPFSTDVAGAIAESKSQDDYPNSDVILVVDLTVDRIYEDGSYSEITHQAQKALSTEGVEELSTVRIEGELLEARTHLPDGTALEPAVLPGHDSLTMPGVEIGAVVEYKYRRDRPAPPGGFFKLPGWYFRSLETPHQWSHYVVVAPESTRLTVVDRHWGKVYPEETFEEFPDTVEDGLRTYRWLATNTRPLNPSAGHDNMKTLLPHVEVGRARTWQDLAGELLDLFLGRARLTGRLVAEAERTLAGAETPEDKARAVFRHVNSLVQADADVFDAHQILLSRAGNRSILLAAMLSAAGLDARFALTRPRPEAVDPSEGSGEPEWAFPRRALFRDTLVAVAREDDSCIWLDAEGPYSPFGAIPPRFQGGAAFVLPSATDSPAARGAPKGPTSARSIDGEFATLPWGPLASWGESTRSDFEVGLETGTLRGRKEFVYSGSLGAAYKELFAESSSTWRETWGEKRLSKVLQGSRLLGIQVDGLDDPEAALSVRAEFELPEALGAARAGLGGNASLREMPTGVEPLDMVSSYVKVPKRSYPMKISSPLVRDDEVEIRLLGVGHWRPPASHTTRTSFGSYSITFTWDPGVLRIRRSVRLLPQLVEPDGYEEFVRFCREVDAAEHAPLRVRLP